MNRMIELLALDFDGVVCDSAGESFLVACTAFLQSAPDASICERLPRVEPEAPVSPDPRDPIFGRFLEHMPLGNRAEDYAVVLRAIDEDVLLKDQGDYDGFKAKLDPRWLQDFHETYYTVRRTFQDLDPVGWLQLARPYAGISGLLHDLPDGIRLAIATARDHESVDRILEAHQLQTLFNPRLIIDKDAGVSKRTHLELLHERSGVPFSATLFVDDKINHLDSVAPLGVHCGLAAWGYNGLRERALAVERGYSVLDMDELAGVCRSQ